MSDVVALILAGGQGSRLYELTEKIAKPAVEYGGRYKIIDFPLSNCTHSGIKTVGVLTQYQPLLLNTYMHNSSVWDFTSIEGGLFILPPYTTSDETKWFKGTAHAVYSHFDFVKSQKPKYVLILSGDHIYNMDYDQVIKHHLDNDLDVTITVKEVEFNEASRFGIMNCDEEDNIVEFEEKPKNPKSNLASMGIYLFKYEVLEKYLVEESQIEGSDFDFGGDIIPKLIKDKLKVGAYRFDGYWKDVGTINSLWEANMDLLVDSEQIIENKHWPIYSSTPNLVATVFLDNSVVNNSLINEGSIIAGEIKNSVISYLVNIGSGSKVSNSVVHSEVTIGRDVVLDYVIVKSGVVIPDGSIFRGSSDEILLVTDKLIGGQNATK